MSGYRVRPSGLPSIIAGPGMGPNGESGARVWHRPCGFRITVRSYAEATRERDGHRCPEK